MLLQYIEETEEIAMSGLKENRHILDMIVKELLENSRITGLVNERIRLFSFIVLVHNQIAVLIIERSIPSLQIFFFFFFCLYLLSIYILNW